MEPETDLRSAVLLLDPAKSVGPFDIHYAQRNSRTGTGAGRHGVAGEQLVGCYTDVLLRAWERFRAEPHGRQVPVRIPVYLLDVNALREGTPFMSVTARTRQPFIVLPSRIAAYTVELELAYAAASAAHEFAHVLRHFRRSFFDLHFQPWRWFDEATAVWAESLVVPLNRTCFEYYLDWSDRPHLTLGDELQSYGAALFVQYLAARYGEGSVSRVWVEADDRETPLQAIRRIYPGAEFIFHDYCVASYFVDDNGPGIFAAVHEQYGGRAVSEGWALASGTAVSVETQVAPLACRYYRFYPGESVTGVNLGRTILPPGVRASLHGVTEGLGRAASSGRKETVQFGRAQAEHAVLVISNDGTDEFGPARARIPVSAR